MKDVSDNSTQRLQLEIEGMVQGVGFRPFIARLATNLDLNGWVANTGNGVSAELEGLRPALDRFLADLREKQPAAARLDNVHCKTLPPIGLIGFQIRPSMRNPRPGARLQPDLAICDQCRGDIGDPANRRFRHAFASCCQCGPRFSIVHRLPWDREHTAMAAFELCARCRAEYEDPTDRRFHAQTNACHECGPRLALWDAQGAELSTDDSALSSAIVAIQAGRIVAIKGLGGFQLLVDARNDAAVSELRRRKLRPHKPFAVMFGELRQIRELCAVSDIEHDLLRSPAAPIVLLRKHDAVANQARTLALAVAPDNPLLGVMLPYTALHYLLLQTSDLAVVATSGNRHGEPIVYDEHEALHALAGIADLFLIHDRPIVTPMDDSVFRVIADRAVPLRLARGYAPVVVDASPTTTPLVATGGQLKSSVALSRGQGCDPGIVLGPYIGDLDSADARDRLRASVDQLCSLYELDAVLQAVDSHPDCPTHKLARVSGRRALPISHHLAHIVACMADNAVDGPVLGVAFDGTGHGTDGSLWGGELIRVLDARAIRVATLRSFSLPGAERAVREPRRSALGMCYEAWGEAAFTNSSSPPMSRFSQNALPVLKQMLRKSFNSPRTSSVGRLFDAVASLLGLMQSVSFEGQAAMALEFAALNTTESVPLTISIQDTGDADGSLLLLDWSPLLTEMLAAQAEGASISSLARGFHEALAMAVASIAQRLNESVVVLSGGCFQNRLLTELCIARLREIRCTPLWHRHVPPNDGGLALGQAVWASRLATAGAS
ncbi:MAG: carbamoyltransferase HypF [Gammaproteobacteria bacterium]|nr:carbamoyltransferase HypF [Gammaproteobacteria bacterium]